MKTNVTFTEIVAQLVKVFSNESMTQDYNATGLLSDGVCGWCGVMSPLSRPAYVQAFGAEVVALAESEARKEIKAAEDRHNATDYHAHTIEADNLQGVPTVGGFFWAHNSGMKCDDGRGVFGEINALLWRSEYDESEHDRREFIKEGARLCKVSQVFTVSAEDFNRPELADELTAEHKPEGGSMSDDIEDGASWYDLTDEQRATLYTFGALVTDGRRYYLIDSEGYDYPRYIYVPKSWREDLADITTAERERIEAENRRKAQEEADAKAARRAEYETKCKKWAHLMEDVRPLEAKESEAWAAVVAAHYRKGAESKAHTAAKRATDNARKRNILAMCRAAFPGVKFSVSVRRGWGADFELTWTDGPTVEEFNEKTDLDIFCSSYDTFDGMTDTADRESKEFTDFSALTMGSNGGNVDASREMSAEVKAAIIAEIVAEVPEYDNRHEYGYYKDVTATREQAHAVAVRLGVAEGVLYCGGMCVYDPYKWNAEEIARHAWNVTSYYTEPTAPTEPTDPTEGGKAQDVATEGAQAPEGLELIETAEGVAVVGDSRTTYRHRKEIKAHGAKWNKTAQRWEAVDAESVENLRKWFGVSASEQTAPEVDTLEDSEEITEQESAPRYVLVFDEDWDNIAEYDSYQTDDLNDAINEACRVYAEEGLHCVDIYDREKEAVIWTTEDETTDNEPEPTAESAEESPRYEVGEKLSRAHVLQVVAFACHISGTEWGSLGQLWDPEHIEAEGLESLGVFHKWAELGAPLNRRACVVCFGEELTAEGVALYNKGDHGYISCGEWAADTRELFELLEDLTGDPSDAFAYAPQNVRDLVAELRAKGAKGEHGAKRAELLALMAEQWQELGEKFAEVVEFLSKSEAGTSADGVELRARRIVALASSEMKDESRARAVYLHSCALGDWFTDNTETTAPRYDVAEKSETAPELPQGESVRPFCVSCVYDADADTLRRDFMPCESVEYIERLDRNKRDEDTAPLLEYYSSFDDFHGLTLRYRFKGSRRYFLIFCTALHDSVRPEYSQELAELREWAHNVEEQEERKRYAVA